MLAIALSPTRAVLMVLLLAWLADESADVPARAHGIDHALTRPENAVSTGMRCSSRHCCVRLLVIVTAIDRHVRPQGKASLVLEVSRERSFVLARRRSRTGCPDHSV